MHICGMGLMKRILENQMETGRSGGGFHFTNANPEIALNRGGVYSGVSGRHLMKKTVNLDAFNRDIRAWGNKTAGLLRSEVKSRFTKGKANPRIYKSGIHQGKSERKLSGSIRAKFRKEPDGEQIDTIGFDLERHGVFLQKGVGRGYVAQGGGVARIAKSEEAKAFRSKENWFNGTLEKRIPELSKTIVKHTGDAIVLNTKRMFIQ